MRRILSFLDAEGTRFVHSRPVLSHWVLPEITRISAANGARAPRRQSSEESLPLAMA
jgi:hypothetical protein